MLDLMGLLDVLSIWRQRQQYYDVVIVISVVEYLI